jgi:succinate dehydrogenase / fumarate reductase iron-sulfur subunit
MHAFQIYRYDPDADLKPHRQTLALEADPSERMLLDTLRDPYRRFRCRSILNCVDVCAKGLLPAGAIRKIKEMMVRRTL